MSYVASSCSEADVRRVDVLSTMTREPATTSCGTCTCFVVDVHGSMYWHQYLAAMVRSREGIQRPSGDNDSTSTADWQPATSSCSGIEVSMQQRRNARTGETGDPRENPPTSCIAWQDSRMRESGGAIPLGIEPGPSSWEGSSLSDSPREQELASRAATERAGSHSQAWPSPSHSRHGSGPPRPAGMTIARRLRGTFQLSPDPTRARENAGIERTEKARDPRENAPANGIVRHDSHVRKSGVTRRGIESGSPFWEASRLIARPPRPQGH
ncbi:hypothetical protein PR048_026994 [Dryococelus australis]|uniref:Uncharacterized protein n=1 Tax=Dryococelus australis TaxID=614101 RepID=A0ABQ9GMU5_9NEOP|nr:hypothetical protein PR048_026994 [Dryococelus australis]